MSNVIRLVESFAETDIRKLLTEHWYNNPSNTTVESLAEIVAPAILDAADQPVILDALVKDVSMMISRADIKQRRSLSIVDEAGQFDYDAAENMIFSVKRGIYIGAAYAQAESAIGKIHEIEDNRDRVIAAAERDIPVYKKVIEYMIAKDVNWLAAIKQMPPM